MSIVAKYYHLGQRAGPPSVVVPFERMRQDLDVIDDVAPEADPVVRTPRSMADPGPEPQGIGGRVVLTVAFVAALLGAGLGALGIGIVVATRGAVAPAVRVVRVRHRRPIVHDYTPVELTRPTPAAAVPNAPGLHDTASDLELVQQAVGHGRTLATVFRALNVDPMESSRVIRALRGLVNLRALQPGDRVVALRDPATHELRRVEYQRSPTEVVAAVRQPEGGWHGERVTTVLTTHQSAVGFKVQLGSVEGSVRAAGLHPDLVAGLATIFQSTDLPDHLNNGDVVRLLVDEDEINGNFYRYGRVHGLDYQGALGHRRAYWFRPGRRGGDWFDPQAQTFAHGPLHSPVPGARISSRFDPHRMHPVLHVIKAHNGMDFAAPIGTPVFAAADGIVVSAGMSGPSGNLVRVRHHALRVETGYAHLSAFAPGLRGGQSVRARQLIGYVGTTGRSTGPHLHFSVRRDGRFIDPESLYGGRRALTGDARMAFDTEASAEGDALDGVVVAGVSLRPAQSTAGASRGVPTGGSDTVRGGGEAEGPPEVPVDDPGTEGSPEDDPEGEAPQ